MRRPVGNDLTMTDRTRSAPLTEAMGAARAAFVTVGFFSFFINLLMLVSPLYMLQIYDRVLTSRSLDTLVALTLLAVGLIALNATLDLVRSRLLVRLGARLDRKLNEPVFSALFERRLAGQGRGGSQSLRDLEALRGFLAGNGLTSLFDSPWTPAFIGLIFLFHPVLGGIALAGAVLLFAVALTSEFATRRPLRRSGAGALLAYDYADAALRNAEAIRAMGMLPNLRARWRERHDDALANQGLAAERGGVMTALARFIRPVLQVAMLGGGAYLVLREAISPGVMIASSIIMGRALAPVEGAISHWRSFVAARGARDRLRDLLEAGPDAAEPMALPDPRGRVTLSNAVVVPPGGKRPVLHDITLALEPGEVLGVIGPSASGKSSLARLLVGVWAPRAGHVRLDGADLSQWHPDALGPHIGYLPQDVELFDGTVAENIARMAEPDAQAVVAAGRLAAAHDMILSLPGGYNTPIGDGGCVLSGGQRQRLGLARALYGTPALIVLDEPNASLDAEGEQALVGAIGRLRGLGRATVVISHRPSLLNAVDRVLLLRAGRMEMLGPRDEVMPLLMQAVRASRQVVPMGRAARQSAGAGGSEDA